MTELKKIAVLHGDFTTKFGLPRQSGLDENIISYIVFEEEYRDANALRGIDEYSHLWLIWGFSEVKYEKWSPMVKPPRLGGNKRMGVFATRSPNRPNPIGLSSVKLLGIEKSAEYGNMLKVLGADLMDGTPIYDIKPYLSFTDAHPESRNGFAGEKLSYSLKVVFPEELMKKFPTKKRKALISELSKDPRPAYIDDEQRKFGVEFAGFAVRFRVKDGILTVVEIVEL